jgi:hypothetical protein
MGANTVHRKAQKNFLDIPTAASEAGYSPRHFRRIIEEEGIPVLQIGRKFFIVTRDFEAWKTSRAESKPQSAQQVDGWIKQNPKETKISVDDIRDKD